MLANAMKSNTGERVAAAWEKYVGLSAADNLLYLRRREIGFKADPLTGPLSWGEGTMKNLLEPIPAYLPVASLQCIHDWERHVARYLWTCKQCGEEFTEFDLASGRI